MDGILNVYKPKEWTSHDIVAKIKKITGEKVGHTGTLDPLAQGVLPVLIGKGTLCSKYLVNHNKKYRVELKLGKRTDTLDAEGEVIEEKEVPEELLEKLNIENIRKILKKFEGQIEQIPPMYSAIKVKGKKLYEYARKGQNVEIPTRKIMIYSIDLVDILKSENVIVFDVFCGKGTYIRTLCEDIAKSFGTIGFMQNLLRTQVGEFRLEDSISLLMKDEKDLEVIGKNIISIEKIFSQYPKIKIEQQTLKYFLNGVRITQNVKDGVYRVYTEDKFLGIGVVKEKLLKRDIIL
mgnify:FL=1